MVAANGDRDDLGIDGLGPGIRIGQGGSAVVYRARQEELDRDVAVKVLGGVVDDDTRRRFNRERRLMGRLSQHEGMVTVYQTGFTSRNEPFIVMPLLGRSLDDEIKQQPVSWERATEIVADVCRTVGFAHDQEIVHRDLKPGNIMMSTSGRPLVADFGIARIVDSKTNLEATALTLTPAYSPPEALETTVADPSTDVYSLGATLFALIAGHPPYCAPGQDQTLMTLMRSIIEDPVPGLGETAPPEIQAVLDRSMAKLPADRYRTADEMADALESAAAEVAVQETDATADTVIVPSGSERNDAGPSRRRAIVAAAVVALLLAVAAGVLVARPGGDEDAAAPSATADGETGTSPDVSAESADLGSADAVSDPVIVDPAATVVATTEAVLVVEGGEVFLLPFDESGDNAFTRSIASVSDETLDQFVESGGVGPTTADTNEEVGAPDDASTAVVGVSGTSDGVFAGTEGVAPCAPDELIAALDPATPETLAWAGVQEIDVASIPSYVAGLTAIVLTADTRITDHRFVEGEALPSQAVLQVGTGVLIDEFGEPQVRCSSGSPLAPPEAVEGTTRYVGTAWPTFEPAETIAVVRSPEPVDEFVLTDVAGGPDFIRPVGSSGAADRPLLPGEVLAIGGLTALPGADPGALSANEVTITFRPEGGDVTGTFEWVISAEGLVIEVIGDLVGTYDAAAGTMSGTGTGTTTVGDLGFGDDGASWSATVDTSAGTISGTMAGELLFELVFTPFTP